MRHPIKLKSRATLTRRVLVGVVFVALWVGHYSCAKRRSVGSKFSADPSGEVLKNESDISNKQRTAALLLLD